jgi:hypothetical protein
MAADEDEADAEGEEVLQEGGEPSSGKRIKRAKPGARAIFSDFVHRTDGATAEVFEKEFERLIDRIVERNLEVVPVAKRDEARETIRSYVEGDPKLAAMVSKLRAAARR